MPEITKMCYDKILPRDLRRAHPVRSMGDGRVRAVSPIGKLWMNGSTLQVRFMEGTPDQQAFVKEHAAKWTEHANLNLEFNGAPDADIRIKFRNDGAWSYVGTDAKSIPLNQATMNYGWLDEGTVLHEFGHAIGLAHEHQNPDGGMKWNEDAVIRDLSGPPNSWDAATIRHNVLNKYRHEQVNGTDFDPDSIMLYAFPAAWTTDGRSTHANETLSTTDLGFIKSARMYPGRGTPPAPVSLDVIEMKPTEASIGEPGEEDLFEFVAASAGRYVINTEGETDLVMKLFGPDHKTHIVAEDDDSGQGFNPKITADLAPGQYWVQIRHYNRTGGSGPYGIKVLKA